MIDRVRRLVQAELLKLFAQPFLYVCLVILAAVTLTAAVLLPLVSGQKETAWRTYNAVMLFAYGFKVGLKVATYVLLIFSSMMFAGEFDRGTIKNLLTRPVTRLDLFVAKCFTMTVFATLLYVFIFVVAAGYALYRGDVGPVWDEGGYILQRSGAEILHHARKAVGIGFLGFLAAAFLGILVSNLTETSGYSVAIALVVFLVSDLATGLVSDNARRKFFMYYPTYAFERLTLYSEGATTRWNREIEQHLLYLQVPLYTMILFIPAAFGIFRSRNITA